MSIDLIYLDKCGDDRDQKPDTWVYYRITPATALGVPAGEDGSSVQSCRVQWPTLGDIDPACDAPGTVGKASAYPNVNKVLEQWGVTRERSTLIGLRHRPD